MRGMTISQIFWITLGTILAVGLWLAGPVMAESNSGEEKGGSEYSQEMIQAFAKAQVKVTRIRTAMGQRDDGKPIDPNVSIKELPPKAKEPAVRAIEAQGLSVETYDELLEAYKANEALRRQVVRALVNLY